MGLSIINFFQSIGKSPAEMRALHIILFLFTLLQISLSAPKYKTKNLPQTVFDQKQTGGYNIQLHLKDFQIIALLADESLGSLGDYDYNYDYSDFTVKPNNFTQKPTEENSAASSSTTPSPSSSFQTPSSSEKPIINDISTTTRSPQESYSSSSTIKQVGDISSTKLPENAVTTEKNPNSPDKIKVQIIEGPESPSIVPSDEMSHDSPSVALGEILHYRRCASGYARDKRGRCRRVRRPSVPFDISRLASSFAARFRQAPSGDGNLSKSSSLESDESSSSED